MTRGKGVRLLLTCLVVMACCLMLTITTPQAHAQAVSQVVHTNSHAQQAATPQINRTDCDGRTDFLRIWSGSFLDCFANSGYIAVNIVYVYKICSGNNSGQIDYGWNGWNYPAELFNAWTCWSVPDGTSDGSNSIIGIFINYT